jgi:hypothetical protein
MFPMKKHAWVGNVKHGAPVPGAEHTPDQQQKGMDSNAAPSNRGGGMPISKPSAGRSVSMPKHASMKSGKEAPPASSGGKVGLSRAGESAQPITADVAPDVSGGQPSAMGSTAGGQEEMMMMADTMGGQGDLGQEMLPPELMAMMGGQPAQPMVQGMGGINIADLIRQFMMSNSQQPSMTQTRV